MEKLKIFNPATGEIISEINATTKNDLDSAINSARLAFDKGDWPKIPLKERKSLLLKISQLITDRASELARLETLNTGKPIKETTFMDVLSSAKTFEYFACNLERYLEGQTLEISQDTRASLKREPFGVALLIIPWNYPLLIASWKLAQALSCANTVILKPSSLTPLTTLELGRIVNEAGLPKGVVNIIIASGDGIGKDLCSDKRIDLISFTGSNNIGKKILEYSSQNVKKLILELGGKSASIILADADFELAVNGSLCSIFLNQGQMCTAMSRIFVEDDIYVKFIEDFLEKTKRIKLGLAIDYQTQMGPLISREQRDKVIDFVEEAKRQGAKLVYGGKIPDSPELKKGFFFEPTVFTEVLPEMQLFQEEVFGPVVCINKFSKIDEAVELANKTDFALAGAIWTRDLSLAEVLADKINAGTIWINTYGMFYNELPYGGFKQSGFGKELGKEGFLEYSRLKNIVSCQVKESKPLVNYWYGF